MQFYFAGGAMEVGGSCIYVRTGNYGILLDAGIRQGSGAKDPLPDFRGIQERGGIDVIVVSHAHMDHTGALPVISRAYPSARIYMTKMTMELTRVLLADSLKLMERAEDEIPKYSENDVSGMLSRITPVGYQSETEILPGVKLTAYPAGHIAGAACLYLTCAEGSLFYSGDICGFAQQTIEGLGLPRLRPDVMLLESTYGDRLHASRALEEERLVRVCAECMENGFKVLIPAFALGRSQEVLLILRRAMQNGTLPHVPVYVDGMIRDMNRVYEGNPNYLRRNLARRILKGEEPFYSEDIRAVGLMEKRDELLQKEGPAVFVSSSGMLSGGPSVTYAKELLKRKDACVILTGYQDEESPGRLLLSLLKDEGEKKVTLDGVSIPVACRIEMVGLSAHADSSELIGVVERLGCRQVILEHGSREAISALALSLAEDYRRRIFQPETGEELEILFGKKREQLTNRLPWSLERTSFDPENDPPLLWDYWVRHYGKKAMTAGEAAFVWHGKKAQPDEDGLGPFQDALLESLYFSRHEKRLFLLRPNTEEEIEELKKKEEASPQVIEAYLRELLPGELPVRKFGYYLEAKKVVLGVDFPDAISPEDVGAWNAALLEAYGWTLALKENMNHNAAGQLLMELFGARPRKISYYEDRKIYQLNTDTWEEGDEERAARFYRLTGWRLRLIAAQSPSPGDAGPGAPKTGEIPGISRDGGAFAGDDWFLPPSGSERTEQNLAFSLVDLCFSESAIQPSKKGRKNNHLGPFIELAFTTPSLGRRCADLLQETARQTGWRIHIAGSVNQNQLMMTARELCRRYGITEVKNPSFIAQRTEVRLYTGPGVEIPAEMILEFREMTGAGLTV